MSPGFQQQDYEHMTFPAYMYVDYVRVYQREGLDTDQSIGCDPSKRPTADYIAKYVSSLSCLPIKLTILLSHAPAYNNPNYTTWAQAGYNFPLNSLYDGC